MKLGIVAARTRGGRTIGNLDQDCDLYANFAVNRVILALLDCRFRWERLINGLFTAASFGDRLAKVDQGKRALWQRQCSPPSTSFGVHRWWWRPKPQGMQTWLRPAIVARQ